MTRIKPVAQDILFGLKVQADEISSQMGCIAEGLNGLACTVSDNDDDSRLIYMVIQDLANRNLLRKDTIALAKKVYERSKDNA